MPPNVRVYHNQRPVQPRIRKPDPIVKEITLDINEAFNGKLEKLLGRKPTGILLWRFVFI